ncbi:TiaS agmantine-binding domain-containing protein [Vulcanisaeta sp. JCM 14467]
MPYLMIGIDDTDWEGGGCTTYVMYSFVKYLVNDGLIDNVIGLPRLTRLNPYVPFKTRGNASLSIIMHIDSEDKAMDYVELMNSLIDQMVKRVGKTSPGIAYMVVNDLSGIDEKLRWFYRKSVRDIVTLDLARRIADKVGVKLIGSRGVIGALASLGFMPVDATYEFIAYRPEDEERPIIELGDVRLWDDVTGPFTFLNIYNDQVLIEPHGPDPVLFGVRGDSPYHVLAMGNYLASKYNAIGWIIYMTNQGTDEHRSRMGEFIPYRNADSISTITDVAFDEQGHALITLSGKRRAIAYRHLGISRELTGCIGCLVQVWGGVKQDGDFSLYMEGLRVLHDRYVEVRNPRCPICGGPMESVGRSGLLRCKRCGFQGKLPKILIPRNRWFLASPKASEYRHLMKPVTRIGLEGLALYMPKPFLWVY